MTVPDIKGRDCDGGNLPDWGRADFVRGRVVQPNRTSVLHDALGSVDGDRQAMYGDPVEHAEKVAAAWRTIFGWDVDGHRFALAMDVLKVIRENNRPKRDNRVDGPGWWEIADRCIR